MMKILMVCLGNICRSPLAEGIMRQQAKAAGLDWTIDSAGTTGHCPGTAPHALSQKVAKLNGLDISGQVCRQLTRNDINTFDRIYVMDLENYREVQRIAGDAWDAIKVSLLMDALYPGQQVEIPDPWYGGEEGYHEVYGMISAACEKIIASSSEGEKQ